MVTLDTSVAMLVNGNLQTHFTRHQSVMVDGESSDTTPVKSGVPQGMVLGPLMFLVYINENATSSAQLFSDDCVIYKSIPTLQDANQLQEDLCIIIYVNGQTYL